MTDWMGIFTHTSAVDPRPGVSEYQANTRMRKRGELQRRPGMLSTAIAKQAGPIYEIMSANGLGQNFLTFDLDGTVIGFPGGDEAGDPWPPPPDGPRRRRPDVVAQDPLCAIGGSGSGTLSVSDLGAFGTCTVSGSISCTENCCYRVRHTITVTAVKTHSGTLGPHDDFLYTYDLNTSPTGGATCGGATANVFTASQHDNMPANYSLVVDGYICQSASSVFSPSWSFTCSPNAGPGDIDRYNWTVSVTTTIENVLCAACHP